MALPELASLQQNDPTSDHIPELTEAIAGYRTTLREPFEYERKISEIQAELGRIEREIARLNRPLAKRRGCWDDCLGGEAGFEVDGKGPPTQIKTIQ